MPEHRRELGYKHSTFPVGRVTPGAPEVRYLVLSGPSSPYLLARVRWPDVCQAISAARPDWQDDPGLFDLPYDPSSEAVTFQQATVIAAQWGVRLHTEDAARSSESSLIRRMPADWSNLSPAEKRAWSLDLVKTGRRVAAAAPSSSNGQEDVGTPRPRLKLRRWRRGDRGRAKAVGRPDATTEDVTTEGVTTEGMTTEDVTTEDGTRDGETRDGVTTDGVPAPR